MKRTRITIVALTVMIAIAAAAGGGRQRVVAAMTTQMPSSALRGVSGQQIQLPQLNDQSLRKTEKIAPELDKLYRVDALSRAVNGRAITATTAPATGVDIAGLLASGRMRMTDERVQVWAGAASNDVQQTAEALVGLGMQVQRTDSANGLVQGLLPVSSLQAASELATVTSVQLPSYGIAQAGSALTQGDSILGSAALRAQMVAADGTGVTVGVISDGMEGRVGAQASGDLPAGTSLDLTTCNVVAATGSPPAVPAADATGAGAEGTAMAEIIHDIVPGAKIIYGYFGLALPTAGTALDFNNAVNCLAQHADVVVDDVGWFATGPYDGTSIVSANTTAALNAAGNRIRGYYTAAGNQAGNHYRETFTTNGTYIGSDPGQFWTLQLFQPTANTNQVGTVPSLASCGTPGTTPYCADHVKVAPNGILIVNMTWNDTWGTPTTAGATSDYDLFIFDPLDTTQSPSGSLYLASNYLQNGGLNQQPAEGFGIQNTHATNDDYLIFIGNKQGTQAVKTLNMFIQCVNCFDLSAGQQIAHNFNTPSHSVPNQADAGGGVLSVAAISASNGPSYNTIEAYSSRGPTDAISNNNKPDITGIDCVSITGAAGFENPFCGTSAAAPHVAGVAALLLACNPKLLTGYAGSVDAVTARTTLRNGLLNGAVALGTGHPNPTFGYGRVSAGSSAPLTGCVDTDGDGLADGLETQVYHTDPTKVDSDGDGCGDGTELGPDRGKGGQRDPADGYDFYDVPAPALRLGYTGQTLDHGVGVTTDVLALLVYSGIDSSRPAYMADNDGNGVMDGLQYDRSLSTVAGQPWRSGPPDGAIGVTTDVLAMLAQSGDICS